MYKHANKLKYLRYFERKPSIQHIDSIKNAVYKHHKDKGFEKGKEDSIYISPQVDSTQLGYARYSLDDTTLKDFYAFGYLDYYRDSLLNISMPKASLRKDIETIYSDSIDSENFKTLLCGDRVKTPYDSIKKMLKNCENDCELFQNSKSTVKLDSIFSTLNFLILTCEKKFDLKDKLYKEILLGLRFIDFPINKSEVKMHEFDKRVKNLKFTLYKIKELEWVYGLLLKSKGDNVNIIEEVKRIGEIKDLITKRIKLLEDSKKAIVTELRSQKLLRKTNIFSANNTNYDIKTKAGYFIIPDFGMPLFMGTTVSDGRNFKYLPRPYFGVNIGVGPINKQIWYRDLEKLRARHWLSFNLGLTVFSIDEVEGVSDLFGDLSLLMGTSVRVARPLRVTAGAVLHRSDGKSQFVSENKVAAMPFISLSIDIDLIELFGNGLGKAFGKF